MHAMLSGQVHPYLFHMNYNENKETKRKFNEQIGKRMRPIALENIVNVSDWTMGRSNRHLVCRKYVFGFQ